MFARLVPRTPWQGGRITDTDVLNLTEAARFASVHAGTEITPADFLRAGGRGEIPMRAICPRTVTMQPCHEGDSALPMPENSIPTLPLDACKALANRGQAEWRTIDGFKSMGTILGNELCRYTRWQLTDDEPDILTTLADCRVTGRDVHSLADAYTAPAQTPAPVVAASDGAAPLTTGDIAFCFDGLRWNEQGWKKPLGNKPKWLSECVAIPGQRGVSETRWNPVLIGAWLVHQDHVSTRQVRAKFQTVGLLKPWFDAWKTYEADNFDTQ